MNEIAVVPASPEISSRFPGPKLLSRRAALAKRPYSILIAAMPLDQTKYVIYIRPEHERENARTAYFSETDLRYALSQCFEDESVNRIIARARLTGRCDLRETDVYLDLARAAALGWYC